MKYTKGTYYVSLKNNSFKHRIEGDIKIVTQDSNASLHYISNDNGRETSSLMHNQWRRATKEEIDWYLSNPRLNKNIKDINKINNEYEIY